MRRRAVRMILTAITLVAVMLGVPVAILGTAVIWNTDQAALDDRAKTLAYVVDRRVTEGTEVDISMLDGWLDHTSDASHRGSVYVAVRGRPPLTVGVAPSGPTFHATEVSGLETTVKMTTSARPALVRIVLLNAGLLAGVGLCLLIGWVVASRVARRLAAPLIYLAAQAEQVGSGQSRARVRPSGIEEIDLVQEELVRTGERMAGRLAAERRFAADASHQLRTPLTALSMRLEEIQMISSEPEVQEEAEQALDQVDRMTAVVTDLIDASKRGTGDTEAVHLVEVFNVLREEWEPPFERAGRELVFTDEAGLPVLADPAKLGQVLATLIENGLRYGEGTTRVAARKAESKRGVIIEVTDEGAGVDEDLAPEVFEYGVSSRGSSGIGLALAKDLMESMGGRIELTQTSPPVFQVSLSAIPASLDPDLVMPEGPVVSVGRRNRRL